MPIKGHVQASLSWADVVRALLRPQLPLEIDAASQTLRLLRPFACLCPCGRGKEYCACGYARQALHVSITAALSSAIAYGRGRMLGPLCHLFAGKTADRQEAGQEE